MRRIVLFEDQAASQLSPISLVRPVFDLRCGHFSIRERLTAGLPDAAWGAVIRTELAQTDREAHPGFRVNDFVWLAAEPSLFINGRWLAEPDWLDAIDPRSAGWIGGELAHVVAQPGELLGLDPAGVANDLLRIARTRPAVTASGKIVSYPWDLIAENRQWLEHDFRRRGRQGAAVDPRVAVVGPSDQLFVDPSAVLEPFVVIDATNGPIWIDRQVRIQAFTRIEGPAYVGRETQLFRANIRGGCSIGPVCRVGGEVEESILHGYVNKYHDGFLGHSYICPWVNLGALTSSSDLKNDYSTVRITVEGRNIDTGSTKVGCMIGDHTKTAIGSLFNTGSMVGVMSLVIPGGGLLPRNIPSFSRIWHGQIEPLPDGCESALHTARLAMARRNQTLSPAMETLLRCVFQATAPDRKAAAERQPGTSHS